MEFSAAGVGAAETLVGAAAVVVAVDDSLNLKLTNELAVVDELVMDYKKNETFET